MTFRVNMEGTNSWLICDNKSTLLKLFVFIGKYSITLVYFLATYLRMTSSIQPAWKLCAELLLKKIDLFRFQLKPMQRGRRQTRKRGRRWRRPWISSPRTLGSARRPPRRKPLMRGTWWNRYLSVSFGFGSQPFLFIYMLVWYYCCSQWWLKT